MTEQSWVTQDQMSQHLDAERELFRWLVSQYGRNNVDRDVWIGKYCVSFYVSSINAYIELVGVAGRGLVPGVHINERVMLTISSDLKLNDRVDSNGMKLLRVSDAQWRAVQSSNGHSALKKQLKSLRGAAAFDHAPGYSVNVVLESNERTRGLVRTCQSTKRSYRRT